MLVAVVLGLGGADAAARDLVGIGSLSCAKAGAISADPTRESLQMTGEAFRFILILENVGSFGGSISVVNGPKSTSLGTRILRM
jgi:hypothetical protein